MTDVLLVALQILQAASLPVVAQLTGDARPIVLAEESGGPGLASSEAPNYHIRQDVQMSAWTLTKQSARTLIADCYSTLHDAAIGGTTVAAGTLTRCESLGGFNYLPDDTWFVDGVPGPRYILTVRLRVHG
jgi:hypothetical protein